METTIGTHWSNTRGDMGVWALRGDFLQPVWLEVGTEREGMKRKWKLLSLVSPRRTPPCNNAVIGGKEETNTATILPHTPQTLHAKPSSFIVTITGWGAHLRYHAEKVGSSLHFLLTTRNGRSRI